MGPPSSNQIKPNAKSTGNGRGNAVTLPSSIEQKQNHFEHDDNVVNTQNTSDESDLISNIRNTVQSTTNSTSRCDSPSKRVCKARRSLNFDSEPVPQRKKRRLSPEPHNDEASADVLPMLEQFKATATLHTHSISSKKQNPLADIAPRPITYSALTNDLMHSPASIIANTRRSQRITLKRLEEGRKEDLKTVESGSGPNVNFSIPLFTSPAQSCDQNSDYGTASENSFLLENPGKATRSNQRQGAIVNAKSGKHNRLRTRRTRTRRELECQKTVSSTQQQHGLSPGYVSDNEAKNDRGAESLSEDDDGFLDVQTPSSSQPWDEQEMDNPNSSFHKQGEWDKVEEDDKLNSSIASSNSSDSSFDLRSLLPGSLPVDTTYAYRIHLIAPLIGYELPSRTVTTRSQHQQPDPFGLNKENGSRLCKAKRSLLPGTNKQSPFSIQRFSNIDVEGWFRRNGLKVTVASPVVSLEPFGTKFLPSLPAIVSIPLSDECPCFDTNIHEMYCLYSNKPSPVSEAGTPLDFDWKVLCDAKDKAATVSEHLKTFAFETTALCYFVIIMREKCPEFKKHIKKRTGGKLTVPSNSMEVTFPKGCIEEDIEASLKVYSDTELSVASFLERGGNLDLPSSSLASPILMLEPHGVVFNKIGEGDEGVTIQLPVPDYDFIVNKFRHLNPKLSIWQSCTKENEEAKWELIDVPFSVSKVRTCGTLEAVIVFQVKHFSFFRAVWDVISTTLYDVKIGMSYWYPYVSFSMKCQANMEEHPESNRFGLEVICYRSDRVLREPTNYLHRVGCSNKPKMVKPGRIIVRLKSQLFEADEDAGEDGDGMVKEEVDFRGRDFEMQYALRFREGVKIDRGTFGKVIVKRFVREGNEEPLFEFVLQKYGCEGEKTPHVESDRWSALALQELAGTLMINSDDNWKVFAKEIGITKGEIKTNIRYSPDPFRALIELYQKRNGSADDFVSGLYATNRKLKNLGHASPTNSKKSMSSQGSSGLGSTASAVDPYGGSSDSDTSDTGVSGDSLLTRTRPKKRSHPSLSSLNKSGSSKSKSKRAKKFKHKARKDSSGNDNDDDTGSRNEADVDDDDSPVDDIGGRALSDSTSIYHSNDLTKLENTFLWEVSAYMETLQWRNLARTLGLDEPQILNIEHLHKSHGFRECAYQMLLYWKEKFPKRCTYGNLYNALCKEGMNCVAKKMKLVKRND